MVKVFVVLAAAATLASVVVAQQPNIGFKPLTLSEASYTFDTAEQPKIRVTPIDGFSSSCASRNRFSRYSPLAMEMTTHAAMQTS